MANRYIADVREKHLKDRVADMCRYSPPDAERQKEHEKVNHAIQKAMETIVSVCPDPIESPNIDDVLTMLFSAKNLANGLLAIHGGTPHKED